MENKKSEIEVLSKRIYEPAEKADGTRVLVDRLWPRGVKKEEAKIDFWAKDWTPSPSLREWFHQNKAERFQEFTKNYQAELKTLKDEIKDEVESFGGKKITLLTANKVIENSHVPTLQKFIKKILK